MNEKQRVYYWVSKSAPMDDRKYKVIGNGKAENVKTGHIEFVDVLKYCGYKLTYEKQYQGKVNQSEREKETLCD